MAMDKELAGTITTELEAAAKDLVEASPDTSADALLEVFNWQLSKKHALRALNMDALMDRVTDQMIKRFDAKPDQFSNDDLLNYMKTAHSILESSTKKLQDTPPAPTQIQNNTIINMHPAAEFDRESRARILAAVQATLAAAQNYSDTLEYEDKTEGDNSNE